jgi:A/G-specific adenine glycosylase
VTSDKLFLEVLWEYYDKAGRGELPWRQPEPDGTFDPYKILVSEFMLQQTQVSRVIPKFQAFLSEFPTTQQLSEASLAAVLRQWSGLGYNRRAQYLHAAAKYIKELGYFPKSEAELRFCKGIGENTARAILCYAFNQPQVFIETNVRTVYLHHYFKDSQLVPDTSLWPIIERTLDTTKPREFYWALMDYGTYLKQTVGNVARASGSYKKQSVFTGSRRKIRGEVVAMLAQNSCTKQELQSRITDDRLESVLNDLLAEGLILKKAVYFCLPE